MCKRPAWIREHGQAIILLAGSVFRRREGTGMRPSRPGRLRSTAAGSYRSCMRGRHGIHEHARRPPHLARAAASGAGVCQPLTRCGPARRSARSRAGSAAPRSCRPSWPRACSSADVFTGVPLTPRMMSPGCTPAAAAGPLTSLDDELPSVSACCFSSRLQRPHRQAERLACSAPRRRCQRPSRPSSLELGDLAR